MAGVQILSLGFILLMLYVVRIHYKKGQLPKFETLFWGLLWMSLAIFVIFPRSLDAITRAFQIYRVFDLLTIVAFMILFAFVIYGRIEIFQVRKKLEDLVRAEAIKHATGTLELKKSKSKRA